MRDDERKKLTANELYLQECMSILYTKKRAVTVDFFEKDGRTKNNNVFNIESYTNGTITCTYNNDAVKMSYDGTNYSPLLANDGKGGFLYKLKPLGIEYICCEKKLDNSIFERKIVRTVGNSVEYYRYLCRDTFFILLEHDSKDENGITVVRQKDAINLRRERLNRIF
jgi:hypothetical protein